MSGGFLALGREAVGVETFDVVFTVHHEYVYSLAHTLLGNLRKLARWHQRLRERQVMIGY